MKIFKKIGLIVFLSLLTINTYCTTIDSLRQELDKTTIDTVKVNQYIELSNLYKDISRDSAIYFVNQALQVSRNQGYKTGVKKVYINLIGMYIKTNPDTALILVEEALEVIEPTDYHFLSSVYLNKGVANFYKGTKVEAIKAYQTAADYAQKCNDTPGLAKIYNNMGNLIAGEYPEKAKVYYKKGLAAAEKSDDYRLKGHLYINLGGIYFMEGHYDTSKTLLLKGLKNKKLENDRLTESAIYANLGRIYNQSENYDSSIYFLTKGLSIAKELNFSYGLQHNLQVLQTTYFLKKDYRQSIVYGEEIINYKKDNKDFALLLDVNELLAQAAEKIGDFEAAFSYQKEAKMMVDSLRNREKVESIEKLEAEFMSKEQEQKIKLLEQEKKIKEINNRNLLITIVFIAAFLMALAIAYAQKQRYNRKLQKTVDRKTKDLIQKNRELQKANNDLNQFNYIASHDIKEPIRIIAGYVQLINKKIPTKSQIELQKYFDIIEKGIKQLYTLIEEIVYYTQSSQGLDIKYSTVNLSNVIKNIEISLEQLLNEKNGKIIFGDCPIVESNQSILYIALKKITENGLIFNNSEQPIVKIWCEQTESSLILNVEDNGIGIDAKYRTKVFEMFKRLHNREKYNGTGLGLSITKSVIEKIGGSIKVKSELNKGTTFILTIPKKSEK